MSKTDLMIPSLGDKFIDLRDQLPGDAYAWSWERDLAQVNYLAFHHTASSDSQTPEDIANNHVNKNSWGGIGYHFLIAKDGTTFYVGDISTARANVANLNEQVVGIGLIGNFAEGRVPSHQQLDSAHKLCEFFINYPTLPNVTSWDKVRGHKELPNQTTNCPGDDWDHLRIQIVEGVTAEDEDIPPSDGEAHILQSQVDSLQTSLASVNQQVIVLQETLQDREQEIATLKQRLAASSVVPSFTQPSSPRVDTSLTITQALINLYRFVLPPGKES